MTQIPTVLLVDYASLVSICFIKFFLDFGDDFTNCNGNYVTTSHLTKSKLRHIFREYIRDVISQHILPVTIPCTLHVFVIGSCLPKDNVILKHLTSEVPKKLAKVLASDYSIDYYMREHDIKIDIVQFNEVFDDIFCDLLKSRAAVVRLFGKKHCNIVFARSKSFDSMTLCKALQKAYGKSTAQILQLDADTDVSIGCVSKCICRLPYDKKIVLSDEWKLQLEEVQMYLSECMRIANGQK